MFRSKALAFNRHGYSLKNRIIISFCCFAFFISLLFSFYNFMFAYVIEDTFFERMVSDEAHYLLQGVEHNRPLPPPRQHFMKVYLQLSDLPQVVQEGLQENPKAREFFGENRRHYHLWVSTSPPFYLLAEVSDYLVVRSRGPGLILLLSFSTLFILLVAGLCAYWLAIRTTRPLTALANMVENSRPDTLPLNFASQYPKNEIGMLAKSLQDSLRRIDGFVQREQHFTRDVSHELRTPISVIQGATELLARQQALPATAQQLVWRISQACSAMEQIVNTLLTLARESKQSQAAGKVYLLPLVEQSVIQFSHLLEKKQVSVEVQLPEDFAVEIDQGVLQIILDNLISNSFQYTEAGAVKVYLKEKCLIIADTGKGIEEDIQSSLCEPLVKGKHSEGFGLGLSIVKRLCDVCHIRFSIRRLPGETRASLGFSAALVAGGLAGSH